LGRLLSALDKKIGKSRVALAFSADHGFPRIPEAVKAGDKKFTGGRLVFGDRAMTTFLSRLNRAVDDALCLPREAKPLLASEGWNLYYNRAAFPLKSTDGRCGAPRDIAGAEIDGVLPSVAGSLFEEELAAVYLASRSDAWPAEAPATEYVRNDFDVERSGDAIFVPRTGVMTHWDPGRGAMHGSHYEYDIHVPLIFWGGAFAPTVSQAPSTPYDLAPTLAAVLDFSLPQARGRNVLNAIPPAIAAGER
jgi:arylsulfatase A-like enzyme